MILKSYWQAMDMPSDSRLIIKKLRPSAQPGEIYRWVLARWNPRTFDMVILDQFLDLQGALMEVDNIIHSEEEGWF